MVTNPSVDVFGALAELELRRVHADDDQTERRVVAIPCLDVGRSPNPVDARVLPEVHEYDFPAQRLGCEWRRIHPALRLQRREVARSAREA